MNIPDEVVEASAEALVSSTLGDRAGIKWEEFYEAARLSLKAAAPSLVAQALRDAADAIDAQRDESNPDRKPDEGWSVVDHRAGRFLGKTVAARMLRARASDLEATK